MDTTPIVSQYIIVTKKRGLEEGEEDKKKSKMDKTLKDGQHAVYVFFSKSKEEPPGLGANEIADPNNAYAAKLGSLRFSVEGYDKPVGFRRMLSNFSRCCDFKYKGHTYRTVEHAFHATKLLMCAEDEADGTRKTKRLNAARLAVDESSNPVLTALDAKRTGGKGQNPMTENQRVMWGSPDDPDSLRNAEMKGIHKARADACFHNKACGMFAACVLLTRGAKLVHDMGRGTGYEYFVGLEEWRDDVWKVDTERVNTFLQGM